MIWSAESFDLGIWVVEMQKTFFGQKEPPRRGGLGTLCGLANGGDIVYGLARSIFSAFRGRAWYRALVQVKPRCF